MCGIGLRLQLQYIVSGMYLLKNRATNNAVMKFVPFDAQVSLGSKNVHKNMERNLTPVPTYQEYNINPCTFPCTSP